MQYIPTIGLEVHVQINTRSKMFCPAPNRYGDPPNTNLSPVSLGLPGALPVPNIEAVKKTILTGLLLGCKIAPLSKFDRKSYFYPDMPKNYQISQYDLPLCTDGALTLGRFAYPKEFQKEDFAGSRKTIRLIRIHLEEDVGKSTHFDTTSGLDFNRAGAPLMEIVTRPDIASPEEAYAFLTTLRQIMQQAAISDADMEKGQLRCDVNISVRPENSQTFGTKVEIKNLNSISGVRRAIAYEIQRQIRVLTSGGTVRQETRRWDDDLGETQLMRTKESAHDYRYFPDPDLLPIRTDEGLLEDARARLIELPLQKQDRYQTRYAITEYDASVLVAFPHIAAYFEQAAAAAGETSAKACANLILNDIIAALGTEPEPWHEPKITPAHLARLVNLAATGAINSKQTKDILGHLLQHGGDPDTIIREKGLSQVSDTAQLETWARQAIENSPKSVADYRAGKTAALNAIKGQVMKLSQGKANPQLAGEIIQKLLDQF
jgi:aspartyl-tRNA(Asn)/glutamyl-tRNA(Gln) amidotransferase subunit B